MRHVESSLVRSASTAFQVITLSHRAKRIEDFSFCRSPRTGETSRFHLLLGTAGVSGRCTHRSNTRSVGALESLTDGGGSDGRGVRGG